MANRLLEEPQDEALSAVGDARMDERHLLRTFLENTPDHVYFKDLEGRFTLISRSLARWMDIERSTDAVGKTDFDFFADEHANAAQAAEAEIIRTGRQVVGLEEREVWPDGRTSWVSTTKVPLYDRDGAVVGTFGLSRDITARKLLEAREREQAEKLAVLAAELERLSEHDELTGLFNRRGFEKRGDAVIESARGDEAEVCVLFTDVDGLKAVNDRFGHAAGDRALVDVAGAMRDALRATDVVGRIGGDEFAAVVASVSASEVEDLCERIRFAITACRPTQPPLSVSIGVAMLSDGNAEKLEELLAEADRAMYDGRHRRRHSHAR